MLIVLVCSHDTYIRYILADEVFMFVVCEGCHYQVIRYPRRFPNARPVIQTV